LIRILKIFLILFLISAVVTSSSNWQQRQSVNKNQFEIISSDTSFTINHDSLTYTIGLQFTEINYNRITLVIKKGDSLISNSDWPFSYPVFRIFTADADNNGTPDICLGTIKKTRFDPVLRKRPFFFKIKNGFIRPLWLGTTLGWDLIDFKPKNVGGKTYITALMKNKSKYIIADYIWKGFGFRMVDIVSTHKDYTEAINKFTEH
jgi:hypothetical protein